MKKNIFILSAAACLGLVSCKQQQQAGQASAVRNVLQLKAQECVLTKPYSSILLANGRGLLSPYIAEWILAQVLDSTVTINWDGTTATVYSDKLNLTARVGELYLVANGRYLYIPEGVRMVNNMVTVPLTTLAEAFGATLTWNGTTGVTQITRGTGGIVPGDAFYNQNDLFWLSRVIYAESGNQSLEGQMAVGNVVMNRVAHPAYPNPVEGVLAQKNQFSTYKSGALANRTPTEKCVIAAKLVLDGGEVAETDGALYFDSARSSWASRNRQYAATLGGHTFYY